MIRYLNVEEILRLHFQVIEDFGGSHGVRDENRLRSVVDAPKQSVFNADQYPTVFAKTAVYLRNIIGDHPFTDGNKRTALTCGAIFLQYNGYRLHATPLEVEEFTVRIATDRPDIDDITAWLELHSLAA